MSKSEMTTELASKFNVPKSCIHKFGRAIESSIQGHVARLHADGCVTIIQKGWWDNADDVVATAETAGGGWYKPDRYKEFRDILGIAQ